MTSMLECLLSSAAPLLDLLEETHCELPSDDLIADVPVQVTISSTLFGLSLSFIFSPFRLELGRWPSG